MMIVYFLNVWHLFWQSLELGVIVQLCNTSYLSSQGRKTDRIVKGLLKVQSEFKFSLGNLVRHFLKIKAEKNG